MYRQEYIPGKVFVVSGPSGVGKKTIIDEVLRNKDLRLNMSISMTTRGMREGEVDGKDYYFRTREYFEQEIKNESFLEYSEFFGNYYGTPKKYIYDLIDSGRNVLLEIDVVGYSNVKKMMAQDSLVSIFIAPPSMDDLRARLEKRNTESSEKIQDRLAKAKLELASQNMYDFIVVNDKIYDAVRDLEGIIVKSIGS